MIEYNTTEVSVEICKRLNINLKGKTTGQVVVNCLSEFHDDKRPSCSISLDKGVYYCFSCGESGSLKNLYYKKFGRTIYKDLGINKPLESSQEELPDFSILPETDFKLSGQFFSLDSTELGRTWIKRRGFNIDTLNKLNVKYIKNGKTVKASDPTNIEFIRYYSDMAIIPIYEQGKMICFEARQLRDKDEWTKDYEYKKVLYPKFSSTKTLYQVEHLDYSKPLYVVEGLMDLISLRTNNLFANSTTTFGRSIKERQFYFLDRFDKIIYIPNIDLPGLSAIQQFKDKNMTNIDILLLPKNGVIKDVNDILQKKDHRFSSLQDLIDFGWLKSIINIRKFDIKKHIESLS